jgi:hypothetical protein
MGAVIRSALARAGVDAAGVTRLCLADEAAAALVAIPDTPELQRADGSGAAPPNTNDRAPVDALAPKILAQARGLADGQPPDFAKASFAELFAWRSPSRGPNNPAPVKGPSAISPSDGMTALPCCAAFVLSAPRLGEVPSGYPVLG